MESAQIRIWKCQVSNNEVMLSGIKSCKLETGHCQKNCLWCSLTTAPATMADNDKLRIGFTVVSFATKNPSLHHAPIKHQHCA